MWEKSLKIQEYSVIIQMMKNDFDRCIIKYTKCFRLPGRAGYARFSALRRDEVITKMLTTVQFAVGSLFRSERFFSKYSDFPLSLKTNTSKFQFNLERTDTFQRVLKNS